LGLAKAYKGEKMQPRIIIFYVVLGAIAGGLYAVARVGDSVLKSELLLPCVGTGILGSVIPGIFKEASSRHIPVLQSWVMVFVTVFVSQFLSNRNDVEPYWVALAYGYLIHLLWEGCQERLPKI
jgi:hypothetical protein